MALSSGGDLELLDQILNLQDEERPFNERSEIVESIPDFWTTALLAAYRLVGYMNEEEQKVFGYLRYVDVNYHGDAKSGYTIYLDMNINQYFDDLRLAKTFRFTREGTTSESSTEIRWMKDKYIGISAEWIFVNRFSSIILGGAVYC
ncbi:hypothetical protein MKW92_013080 [Papaver armeniacum]|nr:hypothetical protein MKW92_013080 [Papaver armeniacum]